MSDSNQSGKALIADQAIAFLTHVTTPRILRHFERLSRECGDLLDCYLCVDRNEEMDEPLLPHFVMDRSAAATMLPKRDALRTRSNYLGFTELLWLPTLLQPPFPNYRYVWLVEFDVDYAGNWRDFFLQFAESDIDFLATRIQPRRERPDWYHWTTFTTPPDVPQALHTRCFIPLARLSRPLLEAYRDGLNGEWNGHMECVLPTLARWKEMSLEDIGGRGPFASTWRGKNYTDNPGEPSTFHYRPPVASSYFHEAPWTFHWPHMLYHPVKVEGLWYLRPDPAVEGVIT